MIFQIQADFSHPPTHIVLQVMTPELPRKEQLAQGFCNLISTESH